MKENVNKSNGYSADIRKIQFGLSAKSDSMGWEVGQTVNLGPAGSATVHHIEEIKPDIYAVFVKKGDAVLPWKKGSMPCLIEYDFNF